MDATVFTAPTIIALAGILGTVLSGVGVAAFNSRAQSKRLRAQFRFQRWETDRQELRSMLDALAAELAALPDALSGLGRMALLEKTIAPSSPDLTSLVAKDLIRIADLQDAASRSVARLRLRLDLDAAECLAIAEKMIERSNQPIRPWTAASPGKLEPASRETAEQYRAFVAEARKITASAAPY